VIEQLNKDAVWILKVKGPCAVSMGLHRMNKRNPMSLDAGSDGIDVFWPGDNEPDVMNTLNTAGLLARWKFVNREVIRAGSKINIVRIRLPLHCHPQDRTVELDRFADVPDIEGDMSEA
jgi:hypothetical protein